MVIDLIKFIAVVLFTLLVYAVIGSANKIRNIRENRKRRKNNEPPDTQTKPR